MKKVVLLVSFLFINCCIWASPSDNFKKSGMGLGGYLSFNSFNEDFLDNGIDRYKSTSFIMNPILNFFVAITSRSTWGLLYPFQERLGMILPLKIVMDYMI